MKNLKSILIYVFLGAILAGLPACDSSKNKENPPSNQFPNTNENQIDSLVKVNIGGIEQWIQIKGNDTSKPVLLFLHGGPGYVMMPLLHEFNSQLEDHFVVVNWDQRGAGLSYSSKIPKQTMTLKQFVSDVHELTSLLKSRFKQDKIYLMGHSFGTVLGMKAISLYPEDYKAYIGIGQVVSMAENEILSYDFALQSANEDNNQKAIRQLRRVGRPDKNGRYEDDSGYDITTEWVEYYGGDLYGESSTETLEDIIYDSDVYHKASSQIDKGMSFSQYLFDDSEVLEVDFRKQILDVKVPVYFFVGRHDYSTPFILAEQYFNALGAPKKELVWFEESAHFPFYEEPDKFNDVLINQILMK